jgi:hypothetical protein
MYWKKIKWVSILDAIDYSKDHAIELLKSEYGFAPYPYKHYESFFTRFYQGYILPIKFGVDKRKVHLSNLIMTGSITREEGLLALANKPFLSEGTAEEDIAYFLKKMNYTVEEFRLYLDRPIVEHSFFQSDQDLIEKYRRWYKFANSQISNLQRLLFASLSFSRRVDLSLPKGRLTSSIEQRGPLKNFGGVLFVLLTLKRRRTLQRRLLQLALGSND